MIHLSLCNLGPSNHSALAVRVLDLQGSSMVWLVLWFVYYLSEWPSWSCEFTPPKSRSNPRLVICWCCFSMCCLVTPCEWGKPFVPSLAWLVLTQWNNFWTKPVNMTLDHWPPHKKLGTCFLYPLVTCSEGRVARQTALEWQPCSRPSAAQEKNVGIELFEPLQKWYGELESKPNEPKHVDHAGGIADDDDIAASSVLTNAINDVCGGDFCLHLN